jgi:hypothetical protein
VPEVCWSGEFRKRLFVKSSFSSTSVGKRWKARVKRVLEYPPYAACCTAVYPAPGSAAPDQPTNCYNNPVPYSKHDALDALQVMMYDHRGVVKSGPARMEQQTSALLAADAVQLLDAVWGRGTPVHVYG